MKKLKVLLLVAAFAVTSVASAATNPKKTERALTKEINTLLKNPSFKIEKELMAYVTLTLNHNDELVVLSVNSESKILEEFIKNRLNYKKVDVAFGPEIKLFRLPVRLVEE